MSKFTGTCSICKEEKHYLFELSGDDLICIPCRMHKKISPPGPNWSIDLAKGYHNGALLALQSFADNIKGIMTFSDDKKDQVSEYYNSLEAAIGLLCLME